MALTEDLELDLSGALSQIDSLGTALDQVTSTFKVDLADALDVLQNVQVDVDASGVTTEIDSSVSAAESVVVIEADTSAVDPEINAAVAAADTTVVITPEIDTAAAQAAVGDLSGSLGGVAGAADGATTSLAGVASAGGSFVSSLTSVAPQAAVAVAGVTALAGATDLFFEAAVGAEAASQRFTNTFGVLAADVQRVDVGNLDTDLGVLSRGLGSSTSEAKQAAAGIGELGTSFGATQKEAALTAEQITALAARAVALNPQLGSVGQATEKLGTALLTGRAKALAPFQLGLTKTAIDAKAAEIALADGGREVTAFDKQAAGAALAVAKLGGSLQQDIAKGAKNPVLQLRSLTAEFNKVITEIGKPLVVPVLDILRGFQPVAQGAAKALGAAVSSFVPLVSGALTALGPVFSTIFGTLASAGKALQPVFEGIGKVIGALSPILSLLLAPTQLIGKAFQALAPVLKFVGEVVGLVAEGLAVLLSPLTTVIDAIGGLSTAANDDADALTNVAGETITLASATDALAATLGPAGDAFGKFVQTSTGFGKANLAGELTKIGVTTDLLQTQIGKGDAGLKEFTASGIKAGEVTLRDAATGAELSAEKVAGLKNNLFEYLQTGRIVVSKGEDLVRAFTGTAGAAQAEADAEIKAIAAQRGLSASQIAGLPAQAAYVTGNASLVSQLQVLKAEIALADQAQLASQGTLSGSAAAYTALTGQIASGDITQANAAERLRVIGLNADQAKLFFDAAKGAVDQFVQGAVAQVPTASAVFEKLGKAADPASGFSLLADLQKVQTEATAFSTNLALLGAAGFGSLQKEAAAAGPAATAELVNAIKVGGPKIGAQLEAENVKTQEITKANQDAVAAILRDSTNVQADAAATAAKTSGAAFGDNLNFAAVTKTEVEAIGPTITEANVKVQEDAKKAGSSTGADYVGGIGAGVQGGTPGAVEAVRQMVKDLDAAARKQAEARSPSRLFAQLGTDLTSGLALGIGEGTSAVVAEAEAIVAAAASASLGAAAALTPVSLPGPVTGTGAAGGSGVTVGSVTVEINVTGSMTESQARTAGEAAADGLISQLEARRIDVAARQV